ncbi:MAG: glycosyltransferase family 9 protein [Arenicella sp.]
MISPESKLKENAALVSDVALVSSQGLGDGLLQLVFAQNLVRQGYSVTFYQNHMSSLSPIIDLVKVSPYLDASSMQQALAEHKVVLFDQGSRFARRMLPEFDQVPDHFIAYVVSRSALAHELELSKFMEHLQQLNSLSLQKLSGFNRSIRHPVKHSYSVSEHFQWIAKKVLNIDHYDLLPAMNIPESWYKKKYDKRVLIHPTSSMEIKNWSPHRFLELAENLHSLGWNPEFTVAPDEWERWNSWLNGRYLAPCFSSILELAHYYYESAAFIGNDSGNGHLASAMGLPVLTIFNRKKLSYPWRPGWSPNQVVAPWLPKSLVADKWSDYLSVKRVLSVFVKLVKSN